MKARKVSIIHCTVCWWKLILLLDSEFEGELLTKLCAKFKDAKLSIDTKLLVALLADTYDNFDGALYEV